MQSIDLSSDLSYDRSNLIGQGGFGHVFSGLFKNSLRVAIKRIMRIDRGDDYLIHRESEIMMRAGEHPNILRYFCTVIDDYFLYIASELCDGTLQDLVKWNKIESGVEIDILYQVTSGLAHLHSQGIVHRNIKPTNILFLKPQDGSRKLQIKIASSSISKAFGNHHEYITNTSVTNPRGTRGWMAPEMFQSKRVDFKVDMFTLGCIFAFTLSHGKHPFGDDFDERVFRIRNRKPIIMTFKELKAPYSNDLVAFQLIESMLRVQPAERPTAEDVLNHDFFVSFRVTPQVIDPVVRVNGNLNFNRDRLIGRGTFAAVHVGYFNEQQVAVKKIMIANYDAGSKTFKREVEPMKNFVHPNIVRYLWSTITSDFMYIVTELCKGNLKDWIEGTLTYDGPKIEDERRILHQVTQGLIYLHDDCNIAHRDIKPHNILVHVVDDGRVEPQMKLADFGICNHLSVDNGFTNTNTTNPSGTRGYMAPEMHESNYPDGKKVDVFALGCVFACTLTNEGKHPFGNDVDTQAYRIKTKQPMELTREQLKKKFFTNNEVAFLLIDSMLRINPNERPTAKQILTDDFFFGL